MYCKPKKRSWEPDLPDLFDPAAAQHQVAVVKYRTLARSDRALGLIEDHLHPCVRPTGSGGIQRGGRPRVLVADLHLGPHGSGDARDGDPVDPVYEEPGAQEVVVRTHGDALRKWVGGDDVQRLARGNAQT